jgi:antitoxin Phd
MKTNIWKLQDAKAQFSEVVRRAQNGPPQEVTIRGRRAVAVVDLDRFELRERPPGPRTMADFVEASKKYRGAAEGIDFERPFPSRIEPRPFSFDEDES